MTGPTRPAASGSGLECCPTCGYQAQWRDGVLVHEAAAFFAVIRYGCDQPGQHTAQLGDGTPAAGQPSRPTARRELVPLVDIDVADTWTLLRARAAGVLTRHTSSSGLCVCCGQTWPCPAAVTAEHNLAAW